MNSDCDKMKDQIADLVTGTLPADRVRTVRQHLSECSSCKEYALRLQKEDQLLSGLFAKFDANMANLEEETINAINRFEPSGQAAIITVGRMIMKNLLIKHAAVAVLIVFVTLYFVITLSWISQINECIRLSM